MNSFIIGMGLLLVPTLFITYLKRSEFKWFRKLKGGTWNQVWWDKYNQGGHICWVNYHVEDSPYFKILKTEIYE